MANENQVTVPWTDENNEQHSILSKIKWRFQKSLKIGWWENNQHHTTAFHLTHKDSIISVWVAVVVICWAIYYWKVVFDEYSNINSRADELKNLSSYNIVKPNNEKLSSYTEWDSLDTINSIISVNNRIDEGLSENETFKQTQRNYYEVLLQNIYLPSLNIWKDPYTKNFNMSVLWQKYLESDKFQDLYLIQYWSDFAKYVWNDADYNTINQITVWEKTVLEWNSDYFYIPITISFSSPNKRSFLLLVNKLSMTSNQNNIALLNEFFFYLLNAIREDKKELIDKYMQEYLKEFSSSSSWEFANNLWDMSEEDLSKYRDRVIGYNLYHWINWWGIGQNIGQLVDDSVIEKAIKNSALCRWELDQKCLYNFREKYRNLPYLAYRIWLESKWSRTSGLLEFLKDLPPAIAITSFGFEKYSNSSFLNNKEEEYEWRITFNAYGRNILDSELEEASSMLWKLCFWNNSDQKISPDTAAQYVDNAISLLWQNREYSNVSSLLELQSLFASLQESYNGMSNYDKMIKLFEIRRMMNDANLCK